MVISMEMMKTVIAAAHTVVITSKLKASSFLLLNITATYA
jgi:hypothetical protein